MKSIRLQACLKFAKSILLSFALTLHLNACIGAGQAEEWDAERMKEWDREDFFREIEISHVIVLCDAWLETNHSYRYVIRNIWRSNPDVLREYSSGDELKLPCFEYLTNNESIDYTERKRLVLLFLSDARLWAPPGTPLPVPDPWGFCAYWGVNDTLGGLGAEDVVRLVEKNRELIGSAWKADDIR